LAALVLGAALTSLPALAAETAPLRLSAAAAAKAAATDPVDLSGIWFIDRTGGQEYKPEAPLTPKARAYYDKVHAQMAAGKSVDDASGQCIPPGVPRIMRYVYPTLFVRTALGYITIHEFESQLRYIYMDGRPHPPEDEITLTFNGHSIAHWEGKTLVIDTVGLNTDVGENFHVEPDVGIRVSDKFHVIERYTVDPSDKVMTMDITMIDPETFTKPWVVQKKLIRRDDFQMMEYECLTINDRQQVGDDGTVTVRSKQGD
jgi:hypothetical protein